MKCKFCKNELPDLLEVKLIDKNGTVSYCPNCLAFSVFEENIKLENDPSLICEVTGNKGAVKFLSIDEEYTLESEIMLRLISYNLRPEEYLKLAENREANKFHYMIHDDFYTNKGLAIQPII